jgi:hypothetical protein
MTLPSGTLTFDEWVKAGFPRENIEVKMVDLAAFVSQLSLATVEAAAKDILGHGYAAKGEAPFVRYREDAVEGMKAVMLPAATAYFMAAYAPGGDHSLRADWDGEFMVRVVSPAIKFLWSSGMVPKYAGFGPRSIVNRFNKDPNSPRYARIMYDAERQFLQEQRS